MNCLNCQEISNSFLCNNCLNDKNIATILNHIMKRQIIQDNIKLNVFIEESTYEEKCNCVFELLKYYNGKDKEYYQCKYLKMTHNKQFEQIASEYLNQYDLHDINTQDILYELLNFYFRNDFSTPQKWYDKIFNENNLCYELYMNAVEYFSMVGDYKECETLLTKVEKSINELNVLYSRNTKGRIMNNIEKIKKLLGRYRNGKPYWPSTEERRKQIASIYEEKGIEYSGNIKVNAKVKEDEFAPINECDTYNIDSYCSFWCNYVEGSKGIKGIYEISAIKVANGIIVSDFTAFIRPWDGKIYIKKAIMQRNIDNVTFNHSEEVENVMKEFVNFIGQDILISTGALGNQLKVLTRALRYAGISKIDNEFMDILDFAADTDEQFDMENNTRAVLLQTFDLVDKVDAKSKDLNNIKIFNGLKEWK